MRLLTNILIFLLIASHVWATNYCEDADNLVCLNFSTNANPTVDDGPQSLDGVVVDSPTWDSSGFYSFVPEDYINNDSGLGLAATEDSSIVFRVRWNTINTAYVLAFRDSFGDRGQVQLDAVPNMYLKRSDANVTSTNTILVDTWYNVVWNTDVASGLSTVYIDGVDVTGVQATDTTPEDFVKYSVGGRWGGASSTASVDYFAVFQRKLTVGEISDININGLILTGGLTQPILGTVVID